MKATPHDPTGRFSDRVENYIKYRPGYPPELVPALEKTCGLTASQIIADIGSGTGILTKIFLNHGNPVHAIEPNTAMREAAEEMFRNDPGFSSVAGSAEDTGLPSHSVDLIIAAQAFHWFDREKTRPEFFRILRHGGWVALVWNERLVDTSPFLDRYETLLKEHATDYHWVNHVNIDREIIADFFSPGSFQVEVFRNSQHFDLEGLTGRALSSSYVPNKGQPGHEEVLKGLAKIFADCQLDGSVEFEYETKLYCGQLASGAIAG